MNLSNQKYRYASSTQKQALQSFLGLQESHLETGFLVYADFAVAIPISKVTFFPMPPSSQAIRPDESAAWNPTMVRSGSLRRGSRIGRESLQPAIHPPRSVLPGRQNRWWESGRSCSRNVQQQYWIGVKRSISGEENRIELRSHREMSLAIANTVKATHCQSGECDALEIHVVPVNAGSGRQDGLGL